MSSECAHDGMILNGICQKCWEKVAMAGPTGPALQEEIARQQRELVERAAPAPATLSVVIITHPDSLQFFDRTLRSLTDLPITELVIVWQSQDTHVVTLQQCSIPFKIVPLLLSPPWDVATAVRCGVQNASGDWIMVLMSGEQVAGETHPAWKTDERNMPSGERASDVLVSDTGRAARRFASVQGVYWSEDSAANVALAYTQEVRIVNKSAREEAWDWTPRGFWLGSSGARREPIIVPIRLPLLKQPLAAAYHELGDHAKAMQLAGPGKLDRRTYVKARARLEQDQAFDALKRLFVHMSLNEELWRLKIMMDHLPFDLEEDPRTDELRTLLDKQIGHLTSKGEVDWYANGSPGVVANADLVLHPPVLTPRLRWLIDECRKHGHKRVLEMGSVDGFNLFQLQAAAPDIEWHGIEVSRAAVGHGHALAKECGKSVNLHHVDDFGAVGPLAPFDAVAVFEVLEHNREPWNVLQAALDAVTVGAEGQAHDFAHVYITTPDGNWSAFDGKTRDLSIHKDHISAYTVRRMKWTLEQFEGRKDSYPFAITDIQVFHVDNPSYEEANGWVFASFQVQR